MLQIISSGHLVHYAFGHFLQMPPKIRENAFQSRITASSHARSGNKLADSSTTLTYPKKSDAFSVDFFSPDRFVFPQLSAVENIALINKTHTLFNNMCKKCYPILKAFHLILNKYFADINQQ